MTILLWVLQAVLAWLCVAGGYFQMFKLDDLRQGVAAMRELPPGLWTFLGALGCLAGIGLIVPAAFRVLPVVTPVAAAVVMVMSLLISAFYLVYGDRAPLPYSLLMAALAAFILFGRIKLAPL